MKIGIIGVGVVGSATLKTFNFLGHEVIGYDKYKSGYNKNLKEALKCKMLFLCLPTLTINDKIDMSAFDEFLPNLKDYIGDVCIKSTVLPGTCKSLSKKHNLNICHNPEFLTELHAELDSVNPHKIVVGIDKEVNRLTQAFENIYNKFQCPTLFTNTQTSELVKYACNCELAMQISYANELYDICNDISADYNKIKKAMLLDTRIGRFKTVTKERGYGGMCFPKDTKALISMFDCQMIKAANKVNIKVKR